MSVSESALAELEAGGFPSETKEASGAAGCAVVDNVDDTVKLSDTTKFFAPAVFGTEDDVPEVVAFEI